MCGIAGYQGDFDPGLLDAMSTALAHRGPDGAGAWFDAAAKVGLAHRRLSIIDLSPTGAQPMWNRTRQVCIVFNGEIYNYRDLREILMQNGYGFNGTSDTEVLLNLYLRDGERMFAKLNGIYAFAIYDGRDGSMLLARDGLGVKPLYYAALSQGVLFASEIKALVKEPSLPRAIDPWAVHYTLSYLSAPAPHTMFQAVRKLAPGEAMRVRGGKIERSWFFYDLPYDQPIEDISAADAAAELRETLRTAVERQMVADVPVGAFLSGGLDSSAVVAFAREISQAGRGGGASQRLQCFTIAYAETADGVDGMTPDLAYARRLAAQFDLDLHEVSIAPDFIDEFEAMVWQCDEPLPDPGAINVLAISKLARAHGIKVLLSGTGGDDLFAGYRRHYALGLERAWQWLPEVGRRTLKRAARLAPAGTAMGRRVAKAFHFADLAGDERIASYFHWIDPGWQWSLYAPAFAASLGRPGFSPPLMQSLARLPAGVPPLDRMLYLDVKHFLGDYGLVYTDKMSMAAGVEVRVPLLDPDLVALAARLPVGFKQKGRVGKWIFKKAMEGLLPREILRRPKTGFGAPIRAWIKGPLAPAVDELLAPAALDRHGLFDPAGVAKLIAADRAGKIDAAFPILALIAIQMWLTRFGA
ncbi:MAG: asparagine synthase (glutamine-hydrolyzing) [Planctomycetota bacterium]